MNIYVFITLYNTTTIPLCYKKHADKVFLLDNGKCDINENDIPSNYVYVKNERNLGLSSAFNKVLLTNEIQDDDFLLFFDQDSVIPDLFIPNLIKSFEKVEQEYNIGLMGGFFKDSNTNNDSKRRVKCKISEGICIVPTLITSSMLTRYKYLKKVGFWNEAYFLDLADFELSFRFRRNGLNCAVDENIVFTHTLGENISGKEHYLNPFRYYYIIRESTKMLFEKINFFDKSHFLFDLVFYPISILLFEDKKGERLKYYFKGLSHGIKKINGELK